MSFYHFFGFLIKKPTTKAQRNRKKVGIIYFILLLYAMTRYLKRNSWQCSTFLKILGPRSHDNNQSMSTKSPEFVVWDIYSVPCNFLTILKIYGTFFKVHIGIQHTPLWAQSLTILMADIYQEKHFLYLSASIKTARRV